MVRDGLLLILSGPSGSGKGTVLSRLLQMREDLRLSVSATTRPPRAGEEDGAAYFFYTREAFEHMVENGDVLEYAEYCGHYYGTPRKAVELWRAQGQDVILEIDVQGAEQVKASCPDAITVFVVPPDASELRRRLTGRQTEPQEVVEERLRCARDEMRKASWYDYIVVNADVDEAAVRIHSIIEAEKSRASRMLPQLKEVIFHAET